MFGFAIAANLMGLMSEQKAFDDSIKNLPEDQRQDAIRRRAAMLSERRQKEEQEMRERRQASCNNDNATSFVLGAMTGSSFSSATDTDTSFSGDGGSCDGGGASGDW